MDAVLGDGIASPLMPPSAAGSYLGGVPKTTLAVWRCTNRVPLPYVRVGGKVMYRRADLDAFIARNVCSPVAA